MIDKLNKIDKSILYCMTAIAVVTILKLDNFSYERGDTKISAKKETVKRAVNNKEYSDRQLELKINNLEETIKKDNTSTEVQKAFDDLKPTAKASLQSSEELQDVVEEAINFDEIEDFTLQHDQL